MINVVELERFVLLSSTFNVLDTEQLAAGGKIELSCEAQVDDVKESDELKVTATIKVSGLKEDSELFSITNQYHANYKKIDIESFYAIEESKIAQLCLSLIFLSMREDILSTLYKAGIKQIKLPFNINPPIKKEQ